MTLMRQPEQQMVSWCRWLACAQVPEELGGVTSLRFLDLSFNNIKTLPDVGRGMALISYSYPTGCLGQFWQRRAASLRLLCFVAGLLLVCCL